MDQHKRTENKRLHNNIRSEAVFYVKVPFLQASMRGSRKLPEGVQL